MGRPATKRRSREVRRDAKLQPPVRSACPILRATAVSSLLWAAFWRIHDDRDSARALVQKAASARRDADAYRAGGVLP